MPLKAKIANKAIIDESGYVEGVIVGIEEIDEREEKQGRKTVHFAEQFRFDIDSKGTSKTIRYQIWTGQNINCEKLPDGKYNKLVRLSLQLGLFKESELILGKEPDPDYDVLIGKKVKFKLEDSIKKVGLKIPNIDTFTIVE